MTVITTVTAAGGADMFAALFEESLKSNDMRVGEVISAEVVRIEFNHVGDSDRDGDPASKRWVHRR